MPLLPEPRAVKPEAETVDLALAGDVVILRIALHIIGGDAYAARPVLRFELPVEADLEHGILHEIGVFLAYPVVADARPNPFVLAGEVTRLAHALVEAVHIDRGAVIRAAHVKDSTSCVGEFFALEPRDIDVL